MEIVWLSEVLTCRFLPRLLLSKKSIETLNGLGKS